MMDQPVSPDLDATIRRGLDAFAEREFGAQFNELSKAERAVAAVGFTAWLRAHGIVAVIEFEE